MKKILVALIFILSFFFSKAQYPVNQSLGSDSTLVTSKGGLKGRMVIWNFTDTTAANLQRIKNYSGALIFAGNALYFRDSLANKWVQILPSGSPTTATAWILRGNDLTGISGDGELGTSSYDDFFISTNNQKRFRFSKDGIADSTSTVVPVGIDTATGTFAYARAGGGGGGTPTLQDVFNVESNTAVMTTSNQISAGNNSFSIVASNIPYSSGIFIEPNNIFLQSSNSGSSSIDIKSDSIVFKFKNGKANISSAFGAGLRSATDSAAYKPMVWNNVSGEWKYMTYWPSDGGGSGGGIVSLGIVGNYGLTRINDSTYKVDSATLAALFLRRGDSGLSYITPKRLADSMATRITTNVDSTIRLPITFTTPSIIQGTSHFAGTIPGANYAPVKLASDILGFTVVNQAVAGSSLMSIMETTYRGHQQFRRDSARFVESGWNDANNDYNANTAMRYYNVMKSTVTDQFLDTAIAANSASLSKVGTWSTYNTYTNAYGKAPFLTGGAGLGQTTSTVSDSIIWVTPISRSVVVQGIGDYSTNLGSYTIWIDGVLKDTVNCQNQTTDRSSAFDPFAVTKVPLVKVYDNLSNTTHTVVIKNISGTIIIDYVGTLRPNWEDQQPIYLHSTLRSQAKGFSQQIIGGGNSVIEEMNKMGRQVVKEFKALNQNNKVFFIDINKSVDYDKDFYTDGVHLTSLGTKKQANDIVNFITSPLSKYNAIDIPYLNYVAANDYPPLAGIQLQQPTATGQDNIGTIRMGNDIFLRWYANNIGLGKGAWNSNSTAINSIAIGDGSQGTGQTVGYNYTLGVQAGLALTSGTKNFFGNFQTGLSANSASENNIIGYRAFVNATDATDNNGFGTQGLFTNVHGSRNTFFGTNSLAFNEGSDNFTGGYFSGFNALTTDGSIYIGNRTAYNATAADYSIAIGTGVDLPSATTAGQLNIGNLIYGNNLYQSLTPSSTPVTGGKIGIGNSVPTALLHLGAGTATAGTAPIKLNTGTALTTPEDGAIEYHGSHIYFTIGSTRYQLDQQAGTNLGNSDLTQSSSTRQYTIGYNSAAGQRYLSLGKIDASEKAFMILGVNSTNHNGFVNYGATDSTSGVQTASDYNPTSQRILTAVRISGGKDARTNHYLDSLVLGFASTNYLTPKKVYNFGADSLIIKGNMGVSTSSTDSVLVRGSDNVIKLRAQSDIATSGTYTPTLTNVANVAASTAYSCQYSRVGTVVTVSGEVDIDPTTTLTLTQLGISLPIASNLTATNELGGTGADDLGTAARVAGDATNDRAEVRMTPTDVTNRRFSFTFTYRIL